MKKRMRSDLDYSFARHLVDPNASIPRYDRCNYFRMFASSILIKRQTPVLLHISQLQGYWWSPATTKYIIYA